MKGRYVITGVLLCMLATPAAHADELTEMWVEEGKTFVTEHPLVEADQVDVDGLLDLYDRVEGLRGLVQLWHDDESVFYREGEDALRPWMIHKRISAHFQLATRMRHDDPEVQALAALVRLHARFARDYMNGDTGSFEYSGVGAFAVDHGGVLADRVRAEYAD